MTLELSLNEKIHILRKRKKLSQKELADAVGVNASNIPHYESGLYRPSLDILVKIADVLGVSLDELVKG